MSKSDKNYDKKSSGTVIAFIIAIILIGGAIFATQGKSNANNTEILTQPDSQLIKQVAPDFTLEKLSGGTISLAEYKGRKPVVLDFFATWCPNCRRDVPKLNSLYEKYKDQVEVIGIDLHEDESTVRKFVERYGVTFPVVIDSGKVAQNYGVRYTNFHVLIDKDGNAIKAIPGDISEADILFLIGQN